MQPNHSFFVSHLLVLVVGLIFLHSFSRHLLLASERRDVCSMPPFLEKVQKILVSISPAFVSTLVGDNNFQLKRNLFISIVILPSSCLLVQPLVMAGQDWHNISVFLLK